jgi:hypothetical protein
VARGALGERAPRAGSKRKRSRDRTRDRRRFAHERGCPLSMKGTLGRSTRSIFTDGREARPWQPEPKRSCESAARRDGRDRGVRGMARSGADGDNTVSRQPGRARRSGSGVVKRQVHRSPGRGCKSTRQGRGASLEEMPVADEARVLVVEAAGSRSRSYASVGELRSALQGKL